MISRGGMGVVYRATSIALRRIYALKVVAPELAGDPQFRERFKREMRIAASLRHSHVVGIHHAGEEDGLLFFVMDYVHGTDLRQILVQTGALDPERAVDLVAQFASAIDAAHAKGLVHRDIKPGNMLVTVVDGEERGYLTDFGLAKRSDNVGALTSTGAVVGTVDYMAPEQVIGHVTDARTDIYALGCVFFEMLTGMVPYDRPNSVAKLFAHAHEPPPALPAELAELYPTFGAVIETAMAKDPKARYSSAGDFARDAAAALAGMRYTGPATIVATGEATLTDDDPDAPAAPAGPRESVAPAADKTVARAVTPRSAPGTAPPRQPTGTAAQSAGTEAGKSQPGQSAEAQQVEADLTRAAPTVAAAAHVPTVLSSPDSPPPGSSPDRPPPGTSTDAPPSGTHPSQQIPPDAGERSDGGPLQKHRRPILAGALILVAVVIGAVIALSSGTNKPAPAPAQARFASAVRPVPTNRVTGDGTATVRLSGNAATVTVDTNGLLTAAHLMHIHGGTGNCPPATAAQVARGQRFISASVGDKFYGGVVASLTQHGDTSPLSHTTSSLYPAVGNIRYTRTLSLGPGVANEIRQGQAVIVVHGIDYNGNHAYDDSLGAGAEAAAPALCGALFPSQATASTPGTIYTASLGLEGAPATGSTAPPLLLCHVARSDDPLAYRGDA